MVPTTVILLGRTVAQLVVHTTTVLDHLYKEFQALDWQFSALYEGVRHQLWTHCTILLSWYVAGRAVPQLWHVLGRWHQLEGSLTLSTGYSSAASSEA